jgi:hypothetical protein
LIEFFLVNDETNPVCLFAQTRAIMRSPRVSIRGSGARPVNYHPPNPLHKPVLDECAFHQLLSAAYTLQQQNGIKEAKQESPKTLADKIAADLGHEPSPIASFKPLPSKPARVVPPVFSPLPSAPHATMLRRRIGRTDEFFWGIATAVAMASVSVLLLGASINHFSPLPAGLAPPSEAVQRQWPSQREKPITAILDRSSGVGNEKVATEPDVATEGVPLQRSSAAQPPRARPTYSHKKTLNRRHHSTHAREADIVAPNTVVRYGPQSRAPLEQAHKYP